MDNIPKRLFLTLRTHSAKSMKGLKLKEKLQFRQASPGLQKPPGEAWRNYDFSSGFKPLIDLAEGVLRGLKWRVVFERKRIDLEL